MISAAGTTHLTNDEARYARNALNYYNNNLKQMIEAELKLEEIQAWLKKRNVDVPDYFLKRFLKQLKELETEKVIISPQGDAARIQEMEIKQIEEKDRLKDLKCPVCNSTELVKNGVLKNKQRYRCKKCKKQFTPGQPLKQIIKSTKHCPKCEKTKLISEFNKNYKENDGLQKVCKDCQKSYNVNIEDAEELYVYLEQLQAKRDNEPITIKEVKAKHKQHSEVKYNVLLNYLTDEGYLCKGKNGNKNIYWLADFEETEESKNDIEKRFEDGTFTSENIPETTSENILPGEPDFKALLGPHKIDLIKLFAADYSIAYIIDGLMKWNIQVPYGILAEFKMEHKSEIHALEKMYQTKVTRLKEDTTIIHVPTYNELAEIFNIPDTDIIFNAKNQETFFWICNTLRDSAIDFDIFTNSKERKFKILIPAGEEAK